jgi:predicted ATPase
MAKHPSINHPTEGQRRATNWYVITGGPSSGKTTIVTRLCELGYRTAIEEARHYLDLQRARGKTVEEIERNRRKFQKKVLNMQIDQERSLPPHEIVFLDRAIPDTRAYCRFLNIPEDKRLSHLLESVSYRKIFILDLLPLVRDYARREDAASQKKIEQLLIEVYESLPFPVVRVPVLPIEARIQFILRNL